MKVLLVHGLGRTPLSMVGLLSALRSHHYEPELFGYASWLQSYDQITQALRVRLQGLATAGPYGIISHSLGGILCRSVLAQWTLPHPQEIIMLAPPNQPPRLGAIAWKIPLFQWFARDCGRNLAQSDFYEALPPLNCAYSIVAGTAGPTGKLSPFGDDINDGIVSVEETRMVKGDHPEEFPVFHTFIMNDRRVQEFILERLKHACNRMSYKVST